MRVADSKAYAIYQYASTGTKVHWSSIIPIFNVLLKFWAILCDGQITIGARHI
jgi:hypothetical protein